MKFKTHNEADIDVSGTSLQGEIEISYDKITSKFGEPTKVDAEWEIEFEDGNKGTIYNWKNGNNYCGIDGISTENITEWHIGGKDKKVVHLIENVLGL